MPAANEGGWAGYALVIDLVYPIVITTQYHCNYNDPNITVNYNDLYLTALLQSKGAGLVASEAIYETGIDEQVDACFAALRRIQSRLVTCWTLEG